MELGAWLSILLPLGIAVVGGWGAVQVRRLRVFVSDPRLTRLVLFLALFAGAWAVHALGVSFFYGSGDVVLERQSFGVHDALFLLHHALLLAAMVFAAAVYRPPAPAEGGVPAQDDGAAAGGTLALAPLLFWLEPTLRLIEAAGFFYLAVRTAWNHRARRDLGSLRVAVGFLLLLAGHGWLLYLHTPLGPHDLYGDGLALAGALLIVSSLPRRRG